MITGGQADQDPGVSGPARRHGGVPRTRPRPGARTVGGPRNPAVNSAVKDDPSCHRLQTGFSRTGAVRQPLNAAVFGRGGQQER